MREHGICGERQASGRNRGAGIATHTHTHTWVYSGKSIVDDLIVFLLMARVLKTMKRAVRGGRTVRRPLCWEAFSNN